MTRPSVTRLCPNCEDYRRCHRELRTEKYDVRGEKIAIELPLDVCESCGETLVAESYPHDPIEELYAKYRAIKGLLRPDEIKQIRTRYKLSQKSFALLLGMSEATINRYEGGGLQDMAHDNLIREYASPESMASLLERRGDSLAASARSRAKQAVKDTGGYKNAAQPLLEYLYEAGLDRAFVRRTLLGDVWDDLVAEAGNAVERTRELISRLLGGDENVFVGKSMRLPDVALAGTCKFKLRSNVSQEELYWSTRIARRAAAIAAQGMGGAPVELPKTGSQIRRQILQGDAKWVSLDNLADYCWCRGIPVLHVSEYPRGTHKPDALAERIENRPIVVITRKQKHSAWLLFDLAHELGHVVCGHVKDDGAIVDEKIDSESSDHEEVKANRFAVELLTGSAETQYQPTGKWLDAEQLAAAARDRAEKDHVDPGHIALNYARGQKFFPVGVGALNKLAPDEDAPRLISSKMIDYLDWDAIPDELGLFLRRLTNAD